MTETILAYFPSPAQGVWHIGPVPIRAYALCIIAGIVAALIIGDRRWVARGGEQGVIYDIALLAVPFGLVGGRLYHVMTDWKTYFGDGGAGLGAAFRIWDGGLGIWGAVALGAVGAWIGCRMRGIPLPAFGDAIAPGIILAQAIGRLGNYFNQELYGRETTVPWGLEIYERRDVNGALNTLNGVSDGQLVAVVHPTFLYELLWNLLIFALLLWIDKRFNMGHGRLFALYVAGYCVGRFWIELMRSDPASMPVDGIRVNTFTSTFVFIAAVVYVMVAPKGKEDPASLRGKPRDGDSAVDDILAKELAAVGAGTGVVAAATVAGADEAEDAAAVGDTEDTDVADAAEAADEAEEPVDADTLEVGDEAEAGGESGATEEPVADDDDDGFDVGHELQAAAESMAAAESVEQDSPEVETEVEPAAEEPVNETDTETETESEAEALEDDSADAEAVDESESEAEGEAEAVAEPVEETEADEPATEPEAESDEDAVEEPVAEEAVEEAAAASPTEEPADAAEADAEAAEADSVEVEAAAESAEETEADEPEAEADTEPESDVAEADTAEESDAEEAEAADDSAADESTADETAEEAEPEADAPTADEPAEATPEERPAATPAPTASVEPPHRKPRWWRRNG